MVVNAELLGPINASYHPSPRRGPWRHGPVSARTILQSLISKKEARDGKKRNARFGRTAPLFYMVSYNGRDRYKKNANILW